MTEPGTLAQYVDYRRLAVRGSGVSGTLGMARLPRLAAAVARKVGDADTVSAALDFHEDAQRRVYVDGRVRTSVGLICQRCLRAFELVLDSPVAAVVVADDEAAANVPRADEPVLADGDLLDVHALVCDELLLALPSVARCAREDCAPPTASTESQAMPEADDRQDNRQHNPFLVLTQLKRDR